ncbi:hypothetical protein [Cupriavidus neocaledonicus]|uniref:Uncharacterized protein n=1 Tax=Cupriavidus neocaledonicus TaxID=1040979 RepID=A0A375H1W9_9BURK|nr:hypothetical protein [Cupriavidus neocaledonicus]SOZ37710.1 hypothetical protein CBM2605_A80194 [Cupriavidus neocaledonicus]SPD46284.1 protein of unknown function [Cupriavidus neocaledonicus]
MLAKLNEVHEAYLSKERVHQDMVALRAVGYESLAAVLKEALFQAAHGKGAERHAQGAPFDEQPMQQLVDLYGMGFALGQAAKKMQESQRLPHDRARAELLGAINYIAGAVIAMDRQKVEKPPSVAANDSEIGWFSWGGGECPVQHNDVVEVRLRDGDGSHTGKASFFDWKHDHDLADVVAYRVTRKATHG